MNHLCRTGEDPRQKKMVEDTEKKTWTLGRKASVKSSPLINAGDIVPLLVEVYKYWDYWEIIAVDCSKAKEDRDTIKKDIVEIKAMLARLEAKLGSNSGVMNGKRKIFLPILSQK